MEIAKELPPPLEPLIDDTGANAPYPIEALPTVLKDAAKAISKHVQAPLELTAPIVLAAATSLAQGRVNAHSSFNQNGTPCSLFFLTLAESGAGKSQCRDIAFQVMDERENELRRQFIQDKNNFEQQCKQLKGDKLDEYLSDNPEPISPKSSFGNATFESIAGAFIRGASIINWDTDEGGSVLCGHSLSGDNHKITLCGLTILFDKGYVERERSRGNAGGSGEAFNRRFSMFLTAQEPTVREALKTPIMREQGLLPRFLLSNAPSWAGQRFKTIHSESVKPADHPEIVTYWNRCEYLQDLPLNADPITGDVIAEVMPLSHDALQLSVDFYNDIEKELGKWGEYEDVGRFGSRTAQLAKRLATVLAFFEGKNQVDTDSMVSACVIAKYSLDQWLSYTDYTQERSIKSDAKDLLDWFLQDKFGDKWHSFSIDRLAKSTPLKIKSVAVLRPLLNCLVEHYYLITADQKQFSISLRALDLYGTSGKPESKKIRGLQQSDGNRRQPEKQTQVIDSGLVRKASGCYSPVNTMVSVNPDHPDELHASEQEKEVLDGGC